MGQRHVKRKTRGLTREQQRLVEEHLYVARRCARWRYRSGLLDYHEFEGTAVMALCLAALNWKGGGTFRSYAYACVKPALTKLVRDALVERRRWRAYQAMRAYDDYRRFAYMPWSAADKEHLRKAFVALRLEGHSIKEACVRIAAQLERRPVTVVAMVDYLNLNRKGTND